MIKTGNSKTGKVTIENYMVYKPGSYFLYILFWKKKFLLNR